MSNRRIVEVKISTGQIVKVEMKQKKTFALPPRIKASKRTDPRQPEQITHSRRYIDKWFVHIDSKIKKMIREGSIDLTNPNRLSLVAHALVQDMSEMMTQEEVRLQARLCGYPENKLLEVIFAVLLGYLAIELSKTNSPVHKEAMKQALEDAYIYPPPRTAIAVNLAERLRMCLAVKHDMSASLLHSVKTAMAEPLKELKMNNDTNTKSDASNADNDHIDAGSAASAAGDTTVNSGQAAAGTGNQASASVNDKGEATATATAKAPGETATASTKRPFDAANYTTMGLVLSFIIMIATAGSLLGMLSYFLEVGLTPWLAGLGLGAIANAIVMGVVTMIGVVAVLYASTLVARIVMNFFKKDEAEVVVAGGAQATAQAA